VVGYRPQLARSGSGFVTVLVLPRGNAADSPHLIAMVKEQITNTGIIPAMTSADDGHSSQQGREEVLGLGVKVVSISRGPRQEAHRGAAMEEPALPTGAGRSQRDRVTGRRLG
jgi:hypothetical protein